MGVVGRILTGILVMVFAFQVLPDGDAKTNAILSALAAFFFLATIIGGVTFKRYDSTDKDSWSGLDSGWGFTGGFTPKLGVLPLIVLSTIYTASLMYAQIPEALDPPARLELGESNIYA